MDDIPQLPVHWLVILDRINDFPELSCEPIDVFNRKSTYLINHKNKTGEAIIFDIKHPDPFKHFIEVKVAIENNFGIVL